MGRCAKVGSNRQSRIASSPEHLGDIAMRRPRSSVQGMAALPLRLRAGNSNAQYATRFEPAQELPRDSARVTHRAQRQWLGLHRS
jgi:hypothetical protein